MPSDAPVTGSRVGRLAFAVDVDNTLLDNDALLATLDGRLRSIAHGTAAARFWELYEATRIQRRVADLGGAVDLLQSERGADIGREVADAVEGIDPKRFLYPGALEVIGHLRAFGPVVILSDGALGYQGTKIARAGIASAADGVLLFNRKEEHAKDLVRAFPADLYVLVDDKAMVLERLRDSLPAALTIHVRQGKHARASSGQDADIVVGRIAELLHLDAERLRALAPPLRAASPHL